MTPRVTNAQLAGMLGELKSQVASMGGEISALRQRGDENHDRLTVAATRLEVLIVDYEAKAERTEKDHDLLHNLATRFNLMWGAIGVIGAGVVVPLARELIRGLF